MSLTQWTLDPALLLQTDRDVKDMFFYGERRCNMKLFGLPGANCPPAVSCPIMSIVCSRTAAEL